MKRALVIIFVICLASPAVAANWHWYGNVRTHIGNYSTDEDFATGTVDLSDYADMLDNLAALTGATMDTSTIPTTQLAAPTMDATIGSWGESDSGTFINFAGNNAIGAVITVSDALSAHVEMGMTNAGLTAGDDQYDTETVYLRGAYGKYKMGPVSLLVGKWFTPAAFLGYSGMTADVGDMGDAIMLTSSLPYAGRRAQIMASVAGFEIALIEHIVSSSGYINPLEVYGYNDVDFALPKIEMAYQFNTPMFSIRPIAGYQTYTIERSSDDESEEITSTLLGLGINLRFGPAKINLAVSQAINPKQYGIKNVASVAFAPFDMNGVGAAYGWTDGLEGVQSVDVTGAGLVDGDLEDATVLTATVVANFKINPNFSVEAGYGYIKAERKNTYFMDGPYALDTELVSGIYYLNAPITLAPGIVITPEIGALNRGDLEVEDFESDIEQGTLTWASVRFAVNF